jgi:hypothetical protein
MSTRQRPYQFVTTKEFFATVNGNTNQYHAQTAYTVWAGSTWDDLDKQVDAWLAAGQVVLK